MADILAALDRLEEDERQARRNTATTGKGKSKKEAKANAKAIAAQNASKNAGRRPRARVPAALNKSSSKGANSPASPGQNGKYLQPPTPDADAWEPSSRSPSVDPESRRISFANPPRPGATKIYISTKTDSLASGFPYDPRMNKYKVSEEEWKDFNDELIAAAKEAVPGPIWMWPFRKREVVKRIRKDLHYVGEVSRVFKKWNRLFRQQRFQAWLELPGQKIEDEEGEEKITKKFYVVISPNNEKAPSVYSRNSSMTRSITGEGVTAAMARKDVNDEEGRE